MMVQNIVNRFRTLAKRIIPPGVRPAVNKIYFSLLSLYYRGGKCYCPCCETGVKDFLPYATYDQQPRERAQCPVCGCMERHRMVWHYLRNHTSVFKEKVRFLHFAPEEMLQVRLKKQENIDYLSADLYAPNAMVKVNIEELPFPDASFDAILCMHVVAHVSNDKKAFSEMLRVLVPGGWALIQTKVDESRPVTFEQEGVTTPADKLRVYGQEDWCRIYGADFSKRMESFGFKVEKILYHEVLGKEESFKMGFNTEPLYRITKPLH